LITYGLQDAIGFVGGAPRHRGLDGSAGGQSSTYSPLWANLLIWTLAIFAEGMG
jgi:hypothetical protein